MQFSKLTAAVVALALISVSIVGSAGIGAASIAVTDMANEPVVFDDSANVTVEVDWMDDADSSATADVTIYGESAYQIDGDDVTDSHLDSETLNETVAEFDDSNVSNDTTFDVELDQSATTVTVGSADIADDGTVDLSDHTSDTLTADDTILSVTATADSVVSDSMTADPGNTTDAEYTDADGLVDGDEYRVIVSADDTEADSVTVDDGSVGGIFGGSDGSPGFGAAVAIAAIAVACVVARVRSGGE
ncbi:hypothetical protein [Natronorubrum sp. FCH18a]|uniref:hypothetical protein n=1 Tax=Natronorubrum sp. FCH18a TaxID=3447018 RepID=UPI003F5166D9